MTARFYSRTILLAASVMVAGCSRGPAAPGPVPVKAYEEVLDSAHDRAKGGDYSGADRILSDFAIKARGTDEAREIAFWRALYMVDPSNRRSSIAEGIRALDIYLSTPDTRWYRSQAEVLKRTAQAVQALRTTAETARPVGRDTVYVNREDEIAALKDQLAKANAELERIKKRLANPSR